MRPLEVSLKLSALGQSLDRDGEKIALDNAFTICEAARRARVWVTVDAGHWGAGRILHDQPYRTLFG